MDFIDYGRSFVCTSADFNSPRFWIESRCRVTDGETNTHEDFYQGASCKSEDTFAEKDLFQDDNYDFLPVFSAGFGIMFRRKAWLNENYKTVYPSQDMWGGQTFRLAEPASVRELATPQEIREATHAAVPIVARTEIADETTGLRAVIECPVKTMNIHDETAMYQVDTGPVLFPDLSRRHERAVDALSLAFVALNAPHFADFVIEVPTPILREGAEVCQVRHYARRVSLPATNRLYAVE